MSLLVILVVVYAIFLVATRVVDRGGGYFLQILTFGVANGAIYALVALGYTMVYGIIELINFAHGDLFTLGGFISLFLLPVFGANASNAGTAGIILPLIAVFIVTMLICGVINVSIERVAYRPLRHAPRLAPLITAVGMSFVLEGLMFLWKGPFNLPYPNLFPTTGFQIGEATIGVKDIFVIALAAILMIVLSFFVSRTTLGKAMRATAQDQDATELMGIDINRTIAATFFIGAVLAGAGGTIFGLYYNTLVFDLGFSAGLFAFTAAVFGGIGNIQGAALGGLLIGLITAMWDGYMESTWTQVIIFGILI
ncbi:MAG: branched-chain amino acid ABC transporter permease, partial [Actinomycetota bacterium]|nr:branched-chain amino acid ABC transporter permease [Actinomycetota bacterium]